MRGVKPRSGKKKSSGGTTGRLHQLDSTHTLSSSGSGGALFEKNDSSRKSHSDLDVWENRLNDEVDPDFFQDPKTFPTLHRVIDVLGAQLAYNSSDSQEEESISNNPAYLAMKKQQKTVEDAMNHMAVHHYAEFNSCVVAVGTLSRQFTGAHTQVRALRRQVRDIKEDLASGGMLKKEPTTTTTTPATTDANPPGKKASDSKELIASVPTPATNTNTVASNSESLRELWLKKLECEAVLSLLHKLEVVREAPMAFDTLIRNLRIGAAVVLLMNGISTSFEDDVAQVKALHKIVDQLMTRKQRALDIVWDTLANVIYLRTGNNLDDQDNDDTNTNNNNNNNRTNNKKKKKKLLPTNKDDNNTNNDNKEDDTNEDDQDDFEEEDEDEEYQFSFNNYDNSQNTNDEAIMESSKDLPSSSARFKKMKDLKTSSLNSSAYNLVYTLHGYQGQLLPKPVIESELDLEVDEMRCLDMSTASTNNNVTQQGANLNFLPRYNDPVMALRILVECLHRLNRLIDVDTTLVEQVDMELRKIAELEQVKTFERMERRASKQQAKSRVTATTSGNKNAKVIDAMVQQELIFKDFRIHLTNLLKAYGNIMKRLSFLAQILRHKLSTDRTTSSSMASTALNSVLTTAMCAIQREIKQFLFFCLHPEELSGNTTNNMNTVPNKNNNSKQSNRSGDGLAMKGVSSYEQGMFSLGIITEDDHPTVRGRTGQFYKLGPGQSNPSSVLFSLASRSSVNSMSMEDFVKKVLFHRTNASPNYHNALFFRQSVANFTLECEQLSKELDYMTNPSANKNRGSKQNDDTNASTAVDFLDNIIHTKLLPVMQNDATMALVSALEKTDTFDPPIGGYNSHRKAVRGAMGVDVEMCIACHTLYDSTGPLFFAMQRVPQGGDMYTPLVAVLEHALLTFNSRVSKRVDFVCRNKTASMILDDSSSSTSMGSDKMKQSQFSTEMESRKAYQQLIQSYFDDIYATYDLRSSTAPATATLASSDSKDGSQKRTSDKDKSNVGADDNIDPLTKEKETFEQEMGHIKHLGDFSKPGYGDDFKLCNEDELMKAASLAHSLLKLSSLMELRLGGKTRTKGGTWGKSSSVPRTLREAIKTIRSHGLRMAKFCRLEILLHTFRHMSQIFKSSTLLSKDVVRLPPCVNDFGEYLTSTSDSLREAAGNVIAGYSLSSLEQYIPICLIQTVRIVATGSGLPPGSIITLNGVESLDRSGSVLYRDLKGATQFENSFWDEDLAADSFEYSASFIALMEWDMDELVTFFQHNRENFDEEDIKLMFTMDGPRRKGDYSRYQGLSTAVAQLDFRDMVAQVTKKGKS